MAFFDFFKGKGLRPAKADPQRRRFQGAVVDRTTASWFTTSEDINREMRLDLDALRQRSRDLGRNNDLGRRFLKLCSRNIVGSGGIILQARVANPDGTPDTLANKAIEARWHGWSQRGSAEITGRMGFVDLCRAVVHTVAEDGEAIIAIIRGKAAGNPEGLAYQLLDTGRMDTRKNREPGKGQTAIIMGVEIDSAGRPLNYWLRDTPNSVHSSPVNAKDLIHVFDPERPEQVRGLPWNHASMLAIHDLGEFTKSALLNARRSADVLGYLVSPDGTADSLADATDGDGQAIKINAPGTYDVLPDGFDIRTPEFAYPNTIFEPFTKAIMRRVAMGMDIAAHNLTGDMTDVNYSSARIAELEERDMWVTRQAWFIQAFVEPVYQEWFRRAITAGVLLMPNGSALPVAKADKFIAHEWQGRRWAWVDPTKDINAARLAIQTGVASPQMVAAQNGVDIEDALDSIAAFEKMAKAKGVTLLDYGSGPLNAPEADAQAEAQAQAADAAAAATTESLKTLHALQAETRQMLQDVQTRLHTKADPTPAIHVHASPVNIENRMPEQAAPQVTVQNHAPAQPAPVVHVAAPEVEVRVEAIMPEQPVTHVHNEINMPDELRIAAMPDRITRTEIQRDSLGNITQSTQREADA